MNLNYALKEGFIDLRTFPMDVDGGSRFTIWFNTKEFTMDETQLGVVIAPANRIDEAILVDADVIGQYAAPGDVLDGLPKLTEYDLWELRT